MQWMQPNTFGVLSPDLLQLWKLPLPLQLWAAREARVWFCGHHDCSWGEVLCQKEPCYIHNPDRALSFPQHPSMAIPTTVIWVAEGICAAIGLSGQLTIGRKRCLPMENTVPLTGDTGNNWKLERIIVPRFELNRKSRHFLG